MFLCTRLWRELADHVRLIEVAYNNSFYSSIGMTPCRSPLCWAEAGDGALLGPNLVRDMMQNVQLIQ